MKNSFSVMNKKAYQLPDDHGEHKERIIYARFEPGLSKLPS